MEDDRKRLSRRAFLRVSALTAASTVIAACGGEATTPPAVPTTAAAPTTAAEAPTTAAAPTTAEAAPTTAEAAATAVPTTAASTGATGNYKEAPSLAGKGLPPVAERLPKNPYVVPHAWLATGKYGGVMRFSNSWGGTGAGTIVQESMYGHSPLRWLDDGLKIGPGLVESWESNDDTSQWTFHFREGLKWSDGQPWTVDDILYWWEDMILNPASSEKEPPDEARSGTGTLATFKKVDDYTLQLIFDAPAPLTADRMAMWVNCGIGPRWMTPKHYMQQFNPKYNTAMQDFTDHDEKINMQTNPDLPVMTGWKLTAYEEGVRTVWDRNPYYWCVDKEGNQLPYIDTIIAASFQNDQAEKLNALAGKIDFGHHWVLGLPDVTTFKDAEARSKLAIRFWDSGSGSGQAYFLNYDFKDEKWRKIIREPKFNKALSHALNRPEIQKLMYYGTGEPTTGTFSPKAIEYTFNDEAKEVYKLWRDSAVQFDLEKAKALLDEIGVKVGSDGFRTFPDGSPMKLLVDFKADDAKDTIRTAELMTGYFKEAGLNAVANPNTPNAWNDSWYAGERLSMGNWGIGDGPNHLVYPQWLVPIEKERWAPLEGNYYALKGTELEGAEKDVDPWERNPPRLEPEPGGVVEKLWSIYDKSKLEPDAIKRHQMVWDMIKLHVSDGPFVIGTVANFQRAIPVSVDLKNVPMREDLALGGFTDPWIHPTPAVYDPESWYFENPDEHV